MPRAAGIVVVLAASGLALTGPAARSLATDQATFEGIGVLAPGEISEAVDVSADGRTVVGYGTITDPLLGLGPRAVRWTRGGGLESIGVIGFGFFGSRASGVSGDGTLIAGVSGAQGFRWSSPGPMSPVGLLPGASTAWARAVSANGSIVVGDSGNGVTSVAFRALSGGPLEPLGSLSGGDGSSSATDVSADGSVIVGQASSALGTEAFRWTGAAGMTGLGLLPGAGAGDVSRAASVSADGWVAVGVGTLGPSNYAFRSVGGGPLESLGDLGGGDDYSSARGTNSDGSIVVGESAGADGLRGFIWTEALGMVDFQDYLASAYAIVLPGWTLTSVNGVSADGLAFVGAGTNPQGFNEGWRVLVPAPGGAGVLALAGVVALRRRR
jgi:probable HAF family extracellular repeat protein